MPAKTKTPTSKTATRKNAPAQPKQTPSSPLPAVVSALVKFADPEGAGIPKQFLTAWKQMPDMIAALEIGEAESIRHVGRWSILDDMFAAQLAWSRRRAADRYQQGLALAVDTLNGSERGVDAVTDMKVAIADPAFFTGMAYACYVLTQGVQR